MTEQHPHLQRVHELSRTISKRRAEVSAAQDRLRSAEQELSDLLFRLSGGAAPSAMKPPPPPPPARGPSIASRVAACLRDDGGPVRATDVASRLGLQSASQKKQMRNALRRLLVQGKATNPERGYYQIVSSASEHIRSAS